MALLDDVRRLALALPETEERLSRDGVAGWSVKGRGFVSERPLRRADLEALRAAAPTGTVLGVSVADLGVKEALLAEDARTDFTWLARTAPGRTCSATTRRSERPAWRQRPSTA